MTDNLANKAIVIDLGSGLIKAGFAGDDLPKHIFPNVIGRPKNEGIAAELGEEMFVGKDALDKKEFLHIKYPVEHGIVTNWDDMQELLLCLFADEFQRDPMMQPVMLTEPALNPKSNREKMAQIMFEIFDVPGLYVAIQAFLALYGSGRTTGVVVDSGDGVTHCVPIYENYTIPHSIARVNFAGRDLTEYMMVLLNKKGLKLTNSTHREIVRDIKETLCYCAMDFEGEMFEVEESIKEVQKEYKLPDGKSITVDTERFCVPEILFKPALIGLEEPGIHDMLYKSIRRCDIDIRRDLCANIVTTGGTSMIPGLKERLTSELTRLFPEKCQVTVHAPNERKYSVWLGASVLADLPNFYEMWVTKQDYEENGAEIIHKKCKL